MESVRRRIEIEIPGERLEEELAARMKYRGPALVKHAAKTVLAERVYPIGRVRAAVKPVAATMLTRILDVMKAHGVDESNVDTDTMMEKMQRVVANELVREAARYIEKHGLASLLDKRRAAFVMNELTRRAVKRATAKLDYDIKVFVMSAGGSERAAENAVKSVAALGEENPQAPQNQLQVQFDDVAVASLVRAALVQLAREKGAGYVAKLLVDEFRSVAGKAASRVAHMMPGYTATLIVDNMLEGVRTAVALAASGLTGHPISAFARAAVFQSTFSTPGVVMARYMAALGALEDASRLWAGG